MERIVKLERIVTYSGENKPKSMKEETIYDELRRIIALHGIEDMDVFYDMIRLDAPYNTATNTIMHCRLLGSWNADYILNDIVQLRLHNVPLSSMKILSMNSRHEIMTWEQLNSIGEFLEAMEIVEISNNLFLMNRLNMLKIIKDERSWRYDLKLDERLDGRDVKVHYRYEIIKN